MTDFLAGIVEAKSLLTGDYIAFHPALVPVAGGYKAAAMLSVALSWTRNWLRQHPGRQGWFWKTREDWRRETGLSRREQETARGHLVEAGIFQEARRGMPARMHYRVDLDRLGELLARQAEEPGYARWDWDDPVVRRLLGQPVALYRRLALATGSLSAGLVLSQALLAYRRQGLNHPPGDGSDAVEWVHLYGQYMLRQCRLTRHEFDGARDRLEKLGLISQRYTRTLPTRRLLRVDPARLLGLLQAGESVGMPCKSNSLAQSAIRDGAIRQTDFPETCQLDFEKPPNRVPENRPTGWALSGNLPTGQSPRGDWAGGPSSRAPAIQHEKETLTPPPAPAPVWPEQGPCCGGGGGEASSPPALAWPDCLLQSEREVARGWLAGLDAGLHQLVLDEFTGLMRARQGGIGNPMGYLRVLVERARAGAFQPTCALRVAQAREAAQARAAAERAARAARRADPEAARQALARARAILQAGRREEGAPGVSSMRTPLNS